MSNSKIVGIPLTIFMWILLGISVGFAWAYFNLVNQAKGVASGFEKQIIDSTWNAMLTAAILSTAALAGLTIQVIFYTVHFREMGPVSASLFFLEWVMIAASTVVYWLITNPTTVKDNYLLIGAITSAVALLLYTVYFGVEIYPFFKEKMRMIKDKDKKKKKKPAKKVIKRVIEL